ncbi:hypothetical protein EJB05_26406, partial [Eragrostis curvula]
MVAKVGGNCGGRRLKAVMRVRTVRGGLNVESGSITKRCNASSTTVNGSPSPFSRVRPCMRSLMNTTTMSTLEQFVSLEQYVVDGIVVTNPKPLTVAKQGEPVVTTNPSILFHPAYTGGWKTLRYFRTNGHPYYTYTHEDHGTIRSLKKTLEILDYIYAKNIAEQGEQGSGTNQPTDGTNVVQASESTKGKDATVANQSVDAAVGGCSAKEIPA